LSAYTHVHLFRWHGVCPQVSQMVALGYTWHAITGLDEQRAQYWKCLFCYRMPLICTSSQALAPHAFLHLIKAVWIYLPEKIRKLPADHSHWL